MKTFVFTVAWIATFAQLLPVYAVARLGSRATPARRWVAAWCVAFFASDIFQIFISSQQRRENLWFFTIANPIEDALLLYALSFWQTRPLHRIAFRVAIPLVILIYLGIGFAAGELATFKTFSGPFRTLVILSAALFTLLSRAAAEPEGVWQKDWMWATLGMALFYGISVAADPIVAAIYPRSVRLAQLVYGVKAIGDTFAYVLVWKGMRCPIQPTYSGSI